MNTSSLAYTSIDKSVKKGLSNKKKDAYRQVGVLAANRQEGLADVNTGNGTLGLAEGTTHTGLQTICTGARKHFVDAENVERMDTHTHVEGVLAAVLGDVLVAANASSLKGFAGL